MAKVNWNKVAAAATANAKSHGLEANITQVKNVLNDAAEYLCTDHEPWEILEAIFRLADRKAR